MQKLPETEITNKETALSKCARDVEADDDLNNEMGDWEATIGDGIRKQPNPIHSRTGIFFFTN